MTETDGLHLRIDRVVTGLAALVDVETGTGIAMKGILGMTGKDAAVPRWRDGVALLLKDVDGMIVNGSATGRGPRHLPRRSKEKMTSLRLLRMIINLIPFLFFLLSLFPFLHSYRLDLSKESVVCFHMI
jgi:hypothetical protein